MLATILLVGTCLWLIGLRADQVNSARVSKFGAGRGSDTKGAGSRNTRPTSLRIGLYRGHTAAHWAARYKLRTRQLQSARRVLFSRASVVEAINLAAAVYRVDAGTLWRKARCESRLNPGARNASEAAGLFQFIPSTFRSTPFASFSIWSPYANALAAGWMHANGRGGEWVCR